MALTPFVHLSNGIIILDFWLQNIYLVKVTQLRPKEEAQIKIGL